MNKLMAFNICALPIFLIIIFTTFVRKTTKGITNKLYLSVILISFATLLVDFVADGYGPFLPLSDKQILVVSIANYVYFILRNIVALFYLIFLLSYTRTGFHFRTLASRLLMLVPYFIVLVIILTNPIHHKAFTITSADGYVRGPLLSVFYIVSVFYSLVGVGYLLYCYRFLRFNKWISLMSLYFLSFAGILIQFLFPNLLVEIFATSIAFLLIILLVLRPEEITDINVGLPSYKAFKEDLYKITQIHLPVQINVVHYENASQVREYLGEERFNDYIMQIANFLEQHKRKSKVICDMYYEAPGTLYFILENRSLTENIINQFTSITDEIRASTQEIEKLGIYLKPKLCTMFYPDDVTSEEEILNLSHSFYFLMKGENEAVKASELIGTYSYDIETHLASVLKKAITNNTFKIFYQPIYNIKENSFHSAEALIRLNDSSYGAISPAIFIPAAEKSGLILKIGNFVLEEVFKFIGSHDFLELKLDYIEINLSVAQCLQTDLAKIVFNLQDKYKVNPKNVNFEITETAYSDIGLLNNKNIETLINAGYTFSLDDYGTGYSNIQRIVKLPLSIIKIDKSLVDEIETPAGASLVRNSIKMMKDIDKKVLAEGVETESQLQLLTQMGCDYIQGFHFSRAIPETDFIDFLKMWGSKKN